MVQVGRKQKDCQKDLRTIYQKKRKESEREESLPSQNFAEE